MAATPFAPGAYARRVASAVVIVALCLPIGARQPFSPPFASDVAIVVSPHPDDEAYAMGQTIASQDLAGRRVVGVLVTDGDASQHVAWWVEERGRDIDGDGDIDRWDFGLARREEYEAAMAILGADEIIYLGTSDTQAASGFTDTRVDEARLTPELVRVGQKYPGADWFTTAPYLPDGGIDGDFRDHPDHAQVALAVGAAAAQTGGSAHYFKAYEYLLPEWRRTARVYVRGEPEALARKRRAVAAFGVIGRHSTPELYDAAMTDPLEYLVGPAR